MFMASTLNPDVLKKIHTPVISTRVREGAPTGTPKTGGYALGWGEVKESWAAAPSITHTGSNTMNFAIGTFCLETDLGSVMMTNIGGQHADEALRKLAAEFYKNFSSVSQKSALLWTPH